MKLLVIGTDRKLFEENTPVRARILEQAGLVERIEIIVFTQGAGKFAPTTLAKNCRVTPTASAGKWAYLPDAYKVGKNILGEGKSGDWLITTQDPFETGIVGYLLAKKFNIPLHIQLHTDPFSREWQTERWLNRVRYMIALYLLKNANGIRVVSRRVEKNILKLGVPKGRVTVVPIFTDVTRFNTLSPSFDLKKSYSGYGKIVLSLGRLTREKNYSGLIRAFSRVRKTHDDALLLIVGDGIEREHLLFLARSLGIEKHIRILPWARDTVSYYKGADVYVQPSLYEGWGLAVIEASSSGAPVVMTDVGCAGEIIEDGTSGLVVTPGDDEALGEATSWILANPDKAKKLAESARKRTAELLSKEDTLALYRKSWENALRART